MTILDGKQELIEELEITKTEEGHHTKYRVDKVIDGVHTKIVSFDMPPMAMDYLLMYKLLIEELNNYQTEFENTVLQKIQLVINKTEAINNRLSIMAGEISELRLV